MTAVALDDARREYHLRLAELHEAIARAERWYAARERQLALLTRRGIAAATQR
jgi:hypothetical protein